MICTYSLERDVYRLLTINGILSACSKYFSCLNLFQEVILNSFFLMYIDNVFKYSMHLEIRESICNAGTNNGFVIKMMEI